MKQAFVGIAHRHGLELLLPERPNVTQFLLRRARRQNAVCFWAVLDHAIAAVIVAELEAGFSDNALMLLQTLAHDLGPILSTCASEIPLLAQSA